MIERGGDNQDSEGHKPRGRRESQRLRAIGAPRVLAWIAIGLTVVLVAGVLGAYAAYRDVFGKIHQVAVSRLGPRPPGYDHSLNLLVIGSDTRKGQNSRFGAHIGGRRSDTVLVLHLSPGFKRAVVLSLPRDSVVPVLACPRAGSAPGQPAQPGQVEQLNQTFASGGPGCLWKTIEQTTHIRLDHFLELDFVGFERVINDLGGVSICLPYPINDPHSKLHLSSGRHHVLGAQALAYWRVRYVGAGSDLQRIARDQFLMASVAQDVKHAHLLGDPGRLYHVMTDIASSLTTDSGLAPSRMISLALGLRDLPLRAVRFVQAPSTAYPANPNWVVWSPAARTLFSAIAHDRKLPHQARSRKVPRNWRPPGQPPAGQRKPPSLSGATRNDGGITAGTNVCRDTGAFAGPLGGH